MRYIINIYMHVETQENRRYNYYAILYNYFKSKINIIYF